MPRTRTWKCFVDYIILKILTKVLWQMRLARNPFLQQMQVVLELARSRLADFLADQLSLAEIWAQQSHL